MTALNYILGEQGVIISMDTLSLMMEDKQPFKFVTKFFPIPHMNCVICGTGNLDAIINWFVFVEKSIMANGIYQLNELSVQEMPNFMKKYNGNNLCTIYQFGLHEIDNKFHGFAYRSTNNFQSEELAYSIGIKPQNAFSQDDFKSILTEIQDQTISLDDVLVKIMHRQKEYDDSLDLKNKIGIGGIVQILALAKDNIQIRNYHYFDDYEKTGIQILDHLDQLKLRYK